MLCAVSAAVLALLCQRGLHVWLAMVMVALLAFLWRLRKDPAQGLELGWSPGGWYVEQGGERREIEPGRRTVLTPWVLHLDLVTVRAGRRIPVWVYADSIQPGELRRLRARLSLTAQESD